MASKNAHTPMCLIIGDIQDLEFKLSFRPFYLDGYENFPVLLLFQICKALFPFHVPEELA
jgi:hypothetical protein